MTFICASILLFIINIFFVCLQINKIVHHFCHMSFMRCDGLYLYQPKAIIFIK